MEGVLEQRSPVLSGGKWASLHDGNQEQGTDVQGQFWPLRRRQGVVKGQQRRPGGRVPGAAVAGPAVAVVVRSEVPSGGQD